MRKTMITTFSIVNVPIENFDKSLTIFKKGLNPEEQKKDSYEIEVGYFLGEPFLLCLSVGEQKEGSKRKQWDIIDEKEKKIKLSTPAFLLYRALNPSLYSFDYNTTTSALYCLFNFTLPTFNENNDVNARLLLIKRVIGEETFTQAIQEVRALKLDHMMILPYGNLDLEKWCTSLSLDLEETKQALSRFARENNFDTKSISKDNPSYLVVLPLFSALFNALIDPEGENFQKSTYLTQGNLSNMLFFITGESILYSRSYNINVMKQSMEKFMMAKLRMFAYLMKVDFKHKSDYIVSLFYLISLKYGEDKSDIFQKDMIIALSQLNGGSSDGKL